LAGASNADKLGEINKTVDVIDFWAVSLKRREEISQLIRVNSKSDRSWSCDRFLGFVMRSASPWQFLRALSMNTRDVILLLVFLQHHCSYS
jgi:hypothetical protein